MNRYVILFLLGTLVWLNGCASVAPTQPDARGGEMAMDEAFARRRVVFGNLLKTES